MQLGKWHRNQRERIALMSLYRLVPRFLVVGAGIMLSPACSISIDPGLTQECLERLSAEAFASDPIYPIARNVATKVGFGRPQRSDTAPIETKQVGFPAPDGSIHAMAFESPSWTKALIIRTIPDAGRPRTRFYVIDRQARLLGVAEAYDGHIESLRIGDPSVMELFRAEQTLWRSAGPDEACSGA